MGLGLFLSNSFSGPSSAASTEAALTESRLQCVGVNNQSYFCDSGYCCGESQCCNYYYEVWWFWLILTLIIILGCCCVCHHRRAKHRLHQQQRQHEINLIAYREAHNYTSLPFYFRFLPAYLLPAYEEVENRPPTPPPPYSASSQPGHSSSTDPSCSEQADVRGPPLLSCPIASSTPENGSPGACTDQPQTPTTQHPAEDSNKPQYLSLEENEQLACATSHSLGKQDSSGQDLVKPGDCSPDSNEKTPSRHRRFTGDSGIEVCVCIQESEFGGEEAEIKAFMGHMGEGELQEQDFCDTCNPRGSSPVHGPGDEEDGLAASNRDSLQPPVRLHLHTINEHDASHHASNTNLS